MGAPVPNTNISCEITITSRNRCQYCRYSKCVSVGMRKEFVQNERIRKSDNGNNNNNNSTNNKRDANPLMLENVPNLMSPSASFNNSNDNQFNSVSSPIGSLNSPNPSDILPNNFSPRINQNNNNLDQHFNASHLLADLAENTNKRPKVMNNANNNNICLPNNLSSSSLNHNNNNNNNNNNPNLNFNFTQNNNNELPPEIQAALHACMASNSSINNSSENIFQNFIQNGNFDNFINNLQRETSPDNHNNNEDNSNDSGTTNLNSNSNSTTSKTLAGNSTIPQSQHVSLKTQDFLLQTLFNSLRHLKIKLVCCELDIDSSIINDMKQTEELEEKIKRFCLRNWHIFLILKIIEDDIIDEIIEEILDNLGQEIEDKQVHEILEIIKMTAGRIQNLVKSDDDDKEDSNNDNSDEPNKKKTYQKLEIELYRNFAQFKTSKSNLSIEELSALNTFVYLSAADVERVFFDNLVSEDYCVVSSLKAIF